MAMWGTVVPTDPEDITLVDVKGLRGRCFPHRRHLVGSTGPTLWDLRDLQGRGVHTA